MKNRIAIICPYYGKFPNNILVTCYSMSKNDFIDWYIFSDDKLNGVEFPNVRIINSNFEDIKLKIKEKIGTEIKSVYKLCDYKPLYGIIFEEYLQEYDFWGYCDLDMVFGNLYNYINERLLKEYDKIYDLGHLSIYRNDKKINNMALKINDITKYNYKEILNSNKIYVLDETYNNHISINEILEQNGYKVYRNHHNYSDIIVRYRNLHSSSREKKTNEYYLIKNKSLYIGHLNDELLEEIAYVHFQKREFEQYIDKVNDGNICITPKGFFYEEFLNEKCFYKGIDLNLIKHIKTIIKIKKNKYK